MIRQHIEVFNRTIHYDLDLEKKITILKGNSGAGKTTMIRLISQHYQYGPSSGVTLLSDLPCSVLTSEDWQLRLQHKHRNVIFMDQDNTFLTTMKFSNAVNQSDNLFLIICREYLPGIPENQKEICILKEAFDDNILCNELIRIS